MKQTYSVLFFLAVTLVSFSQTDSTSVILEEITTSDSTALILADSLAFQKTHSPRKATILSAVLPGAGQFYNKKYWKIPIVYGGLGLSIYYINDNHSEINYYRKNLEALNDDDPNTINETGLPQVALLEQIDFYKRLRDISYIAVAGVYILQIIDAHVDGYLTRFDVNDELSVVAAPSIMYTTSFQPSISLTLNF